MLHAALRAPGRARDDTVEIEAAGRHHRRRRSTSPAMLRSLKAIMACQVTRWHASASPMPASRLSASADAGSKVVLRAVSVLAVGRRRCRNQDDQWPRDHRPGRAARRKLVRARAGSWAYACTTRAPSATAAGAPRPPGRPPRPAANSTPLRHRRTFDQPRRDAGQRRGLPRAKDAPRAAPPPMDDGEIMHQNGMTTRCSVRPPASRPAPASPRWPNAWRDDGRSRR